MKHFIKPPYPELEPKVGPAYEERLKDMAEAIYYAFEGKITNPEVDEIIAKLQNQEQDDSLEEIGNRLGDLFVCADAYKNANDYQKANDIRGMIFDYAVRTEDPRISFEYEYYYYDDLPILAEFVDDPQYVYELNYHGLAVLRFDDGKKKGYLNIPLPMLSPEAVNVFIRKAIPVERKNHQRKNFSSLSSPDRVFEGL